MKKLLTSSAIVLSLAFSGLVVPPPAPAEAHAVGCKTKAKKPVKLSGTVVRGTATVVCKKDPRLFDLEHVQTRRLSSYLEVKPARGRAPYMDSRTLVHEGWNRKFKSGPQRPDVKCKRGTWVRTVAVHSVYAAELYGGYGRSDTIKRSRWLKC